MEKESRILISGAGVAGLAAAILLGRKGFRPVVVERSPEVRAEGYLISLSHRAHQAAETLGLLPALEARRIGITASSYHDRTGRTLLALDYERLFRGLRIVQISRDDLEAVLYEAAKDLVEIRCGVSATRIAQKESRVQVAFSDGRAEEFDAVIGADGLHSAVRELGFPPATIRRHRLGLMAAAFPLPNFLGMERKFETHMERDRYLVLFTTRTRGLGAVFVWASDVEAAPGPEDRLAWLRKAYAGSSELAGEVLRLAPEGRPIYMDSLCQIEMDRWRAGRLAIVGDAAHCLTLFSGRGASAAFTGATRLAEALVELPAEEAFRRYEAETRPVLSAIQTATRHAAQWYVPRSRLRETLRNNAMRLLPNVVFQAYFRGKYSRG
ncbi:MAG: FAD-dependent monooxygenase [Pseudomonadota bacterium]